MAITDRPEQHFDPKDFDNFIAAHGAPAIWRRARTCPCLDRDTGQPSINCPFCRDLPGTLWDAGSELRVLAPNRQRKDEYLEPGLLMEGMLFLTFPSTVTPGRNDQIVLTASEMVVADERHVRGETRAGRSTERLRMRPCIGVEFCDAIVDGALTSFTEGSEFSISDVGDIVWSDPPADGTQYTLRYRTRSTYVVLSPFSRDENGTKQPYRAIAQRLDFWRRPPVGED